MPVPPAVQQRLDKFCNNLRLLAEQKGTEIFTRRISSQLQSQLQSLEQLIDAQEEALTTEIQRTEAMLQGRTLDSWRELIERAKKKIAEEREEFFRQAKTELGRAKTDFAAEFIPNNLMQKIEVFTRDLEPIVTGLQGQVCIQLQPRSGIDLHQAMLQFCQAELVQWGNHQWERICRTLNEGGLQELLQRSYTQLNYLPSLHLTNTFNPPPVQLDFRNSLEGSFIAVQINISYAESSGDAFSGIARIAILAGGAMMGLSSGSPYAVIQGVSTISGLTKLIGESLNRPKQQQLKLEQVVDSLRRNTCTYYQKIARYLLERVAQDAGVSNRCSRPPISKIP